MKMKTQFIVIGVLVGSIFICIMPVLAFAMAFTAGSSAGYSVTGSNMSIVQSALVLSSRMFGDHNNEYDRNDPIISVAVHFWETEIVKPSLIASGDLECVTFVRGAYEMAGYHFGAPGDARDWWDSAQSRGAIPPSEWQRIPKGQMPMPGDAIVWDYDPAGHIAIIVEVQPPTGGKDGMIVVAQGNWGGGNYKNPISGRENLESFTLHSNLSLSGWRSDVIRGYIRAPGSTGNLDLPVGGYYGTNTIPESFYDSIPKSRWQYIDMAIAAAKKHGIDPYLYVRQIRQESGFNPGSHSPAGAVGIAQFLPSTAKGWGVNPYDPASALDGGARYMKYYRDKYLGKVYNGYRFDLLNAHGLALVAYNAGGGNSNRVAKYGANWRDHINIRETSNYVRIIMG